jgi:muramoyltetrapeptide carboxypeptidase LdcA involved in peptidoglycan recycling
MLSSLVKPASLMSGDKVAVVSLSWGGPDTFPYRYEAGKKQIQDTFGVHVVEMPNTAKSAEYLARNPRARADDLMEAFADPSIKAIISSIGGDDSIRLLPYYDFDVIRQNPKIFLGYSDATVTHFACLKAGLSSFYGPSIMSGFAENCGIIPYMAESVHNTLFSSSPLSMIPHAQEWTDESLPWSNPSNQMVRRKRFPAMGWQVKQGQGKITGRLIGGCFEVLETIKGTDLWPAPSLWDNAILFLEVSEEQPPEVIFKRGIRNYGAAGILQRLKGIFFGRPGGSLPLEQIEKYDGILHEVVSQEFGLKDMSIVTQMDFGHTHPKFVVPYGMLIEFDCEIRSLSFLESATTL